MEMEWRDILGYEGLYKVSEYGDIASLIGKKIKLLKGYYNKNGYKAFELYKNSIGTTFNSHVLVARAFIPNPDNLPIVEHNDDNRINNHYSNLKWSTNSNNSINRHYRGAKDKIRAVLQYDINGNFIARHSSITNAVISLGKPASHRSAISQNLNLNRNIAFGFIWKYENEVNIAGQSLKIL